MEKVKNPKLALSIITKDEHEDLDKALKTVAQFVDGIFITHTSKDNEKQIKKVCEKYKANYSYFKWVDDFSKARNFAMKQIPEEYTHMMWLDCDDVVLGGAFIKSEFKKMTEIGQKSLLVEYLYLLSPEGRSHFMKTGKVDYEQLLLTHTRERIVTLDGSFEWAGKLHETLVPKNTEMGVGESNKFKILHLADIEKLRGSSERNIRILGKARKEELKKGEVDPRTTFVLARCYFDRKNEEGFKHAEELFREHIANSGWDEEICQSWNYLSDIFRFRADLPNAMTCSFEALKIDPRFPEVYAGIAMNYLLGGRWDRAYFWAMKGVAMEDPPNTTITRQPRSLQSNLLLALSQSALKLNKLDEAWAAMSKLAQLNPGDRDLQAKLGFLRNLLQEREVTKKYVDISSFLSETGQKEKLEALVKAIPSGYAGNPILAGLKKTHTKPHKWSEGSVVFYCGPGFELWSPESIKKGIGGSEEAIIYLAWELAKRGREVVVYGDPPVEKEYDGVTYKVHFDFNIEDEFDTLVIWRRPQLLDKKFKAKKILLDLHDVPNALDYTKERLKNVDKILVKSQYHREFIPDVPDDKIAIVPNGMNVHQLESVSLDWKEGRMFYGSSYDRGLEGLLKIWPDIIKEVPGVKLHICYGWNLFDSAYRNNPERMAWKDEMVKMMEQKGVIDHGRIGHRELASLMGKCSILAYPCTFEEIHCITATRAQALGVIPVVNDYAALKETVQFGEKVPVKGNVKGKKQLEEYKKALLKALSIDKGSNTATYERDKMIQWARKNYSWETIGGKWDKIIKNGKS